MIKATLGRSVDAALERVFPFLLSRPLNPNLLSVMGVLISLSGAVSFARGALPLGGVLLLVGGFFDVMDGAVARHNDTTSSFGAFLDSTLDRIVDMAILLGILMHYAKAGDLPLALLAGLASIATVLVSYTKARAESIVSDFNGGIMERFERVVLLVAGALTGYLPLCLGIVAAGSAITAVQRVVMAYREMAQVDAAAQGEKT
ncbi:MAG: CDP-alcohol phosphatidyltransferase family protein [Candidatus Deferrimicrobiaceae bacterium]